ncbi:MAG: hypothetical protein JKY55_04030 [Aliivibrio sp.]|uniref:hypothetical protein n=1 Tax=Aliivibrio sp. TaxID=1872443 RepID=UPI001A3C7CD1|nr:hypothetical protein [Aliivibrio sp.]
MTNLEPHPLDDAIKEIGIEWIAKLKKQVHQSKLMTKPKAQPLKTHCVDIRYSRSYQIQAQRAQMSR